MQQTVAIIGAGLAARRQANGWFYCVMSLFSSLPVCEFTSLLYRKLPRSRNAPQHQGIFRNQISLATYNWKLEIFISQNSL